MDIETSEQAEAETERFFMYGEIAFVILLFVVGTLANGPVLLLYFRSRHIRSIIDKFLLNLLLADIISVLVLLPLILISFLQTHQSPAASLLKINDKNHHFHHQTSYNVHVGQNGTRELHLSESESEAITFTSSSLSLRLEKFDWGCALSNGVVSGLATASVLAALEIALERYLAVVKPLQYHKFLTTHSIFAISLLGGIISLVTAVISALEPNFSVFPHCFEVKAIENERQRIFRQSIFSQKFTAEGRVQLQEQSQWGNLRDPHFHSTGDLMWALYSLGCAIFLFIFPVMLMLYIYTRIWIEARNQKTKITKQYKPYFLPTIPNNVDSIGKISKLKEAVLPIIVKFRLINRLKVTRMDRAGRVAIIALIVTILCWSPYYYVRAYTAIQTLMVIYGYSSQVTALSSASSTTTAWSWTSSVLPLFFAALHPLLSPIFYAYRYKKMREKFYKGFNKYFCLSFHGVRNKNVMDDKSKGGLTTTNSSAAATTNTATNNSSILGLSSTACIRQTIIIPLPSSAVMELGSEATKVVSSHPSEVLTVTPECPCNSLGDVPVLPTYPSALLEDDGGYNKSTLQCPKPPQPQPPPYICINLTCQEDDEPLNDMDESHTETNIDSQPDLDNKSTTFSASTVVRMERSLSNFVHCLNVWWSFYSRRWLHHRESVTSTSSFITLLSNKYHNKTNSVANV